MEYGSDAYRRLTEDGDFTLLTSSYLPVEEIDNLTMRASSSSDVLDSVDCSQTRISFNADLATDLDLDQLLDIMNSSPAHNDHETDRSSDDSSSSTSPTKHGAEVDLDSSDWDPTPSSPESPDAFSFYYNNCSRLFNNTTTDDLLTNKCCLPLDTAEEALSSIFGLWRDEPTMVAGSNHEKTGKGKQCHGDHLSRHSAQGIIKSRGNQVGGKNTRSPIRHETRKEKLPKIIEFLYRSLEDAFLSPVCIAWTNRKAGEFRILKSYELAKRWGCSRAGKRKPTTDNEEGKDCRFRYEYFSRAVRHYYKRDLISRLQGQKLVYKFGARFWQLINE